MKDKWKSALEAEVLMEVANTLHELNRNERNRTTRRLNDLTSFVCDDCCRILEEDSDVKLKSRESEGEHTKWSERMNLGIRALENEK